MFCNVFYLHITDLKTNSFRLNTFDPRSIYLEIYEKSGTWRISTFFFHDPEYYNTISMLNLNRHQTNNVSTVFLFIKFLVDLWDPRHLQGSRIDNIFVFRTKTVFYLISNYIFVHKIHLVYFFPIKSYMHTELSSLQMQNWNRKYKLSLFITN